MKVLNYTMFQLFCNFFKFYIFIGYFKKVKHGKGKSIKFV